MKRRGLLAGVLALLALVPLALPPFYVTLFNYIGLYSIVALGLLLLTGVAGQISFGQAAFVGLGAYITAVLTTRYGLSPWLSLLAALIVTGLVSYLLGFITLRMSGHYLPLATIAWGISLYYLFGTLPTLGGFSGLTGIPALTLFGFELRSEKAYYTLIWLTTMASLWVTSNLLDSRPGRTIRALKGRASMAEAFGVNPARLRIVVFVYAAWLACISGWLYAHLQRFINPSPFGLNVGIEYLFMAVVGGAGSVWGAVVGAGLITVLKQALQDYAPALLGKSGQFEIIVFGVLIVFLLHRAREGVWPSIQRLLPQPTDGIVADAASLPRREPTSPGERLLVVKSVRKEFGGLVAVKDVSFELRTSEILGLIGPNGAGKSTLFNLISGYRPMTRGEVVFNGQTISGREAYDIAQLGLARTFQHVKLIPQMSLLENVAIGANLRGTSGVLKACLGLDHDEETRLLAEAARQIRRVALERYMHDPVASLPLGQQRIVEIARALTADPLLLLLDEPAAGLRYKEKQQLASLLKDLRRQGMSILLVEHDMDFVMGLSDRLVVMEFGQKLAEGPPAEVQRDPAVQKAYLGGVA